MYEARCTRGHGGCSRSAHRSRGHADVERRRRTGFTIKLTQAGNKVTKLKAGTYVFKIADKSTIHNFHLTGPGVNKKTTVGGQGTSTWKLTLKKGVYKYVCDPHASFMKGSFIVS